MNYVNTGCSEYQRYQLLRAIHNLNESIAFFIELFRISKISTFESNSQPGHKKANERSCCSEYQRYQLLRAIHNLDDLVKPVLLVVPNIKDINFWEQFTTKSDKRNNATSCSEYQRYQLLRAIHNWSTQSTDFRSLFRISKISTFESNSQHDVDGRYPSFGCSEYQRYQLLRAIHNQGRKLSKKQGSCSEYQRYQLLRAIHNRRNRNL